MIKKGITLLLLATIALVATAQTPSQANRKLSLASFIINQLYVDSVDDNKLTEDAIRGMLDKLDPHSGYMTPEEVKELNEPLEGNFDGIGVQFKMNNDTLYVIQTVVGGPSEKVGVQAGDRIVAVNDTAIAGVKMPDREIMKRLRGEKGSEVEISVLRNGVKNPILFKIIRDKIPIYSIDATYMADKNTGYINISRFGATTAQEFAEALAKLKKEGMKNLIIDLQSNGGGYMEAAVDVADQLLPANQMIVYMEGRSTPRRESFATGNGLFEDGRIVVLLNEESASASEILSGAIQDWDRGLTVGRRTFGKGLVQSPIPLPDGSMLRLTIARYYTPAGRSIQRPYNKGLDNYRRDLIDRFNKGELMSADSIHFPDSLKYQTLVNKRTVYGGGGIMPDIFVPLDTALFTDYHRDLLASGSLIKYSLGYIDSHRKELNKKYKNIDAFAQKFEVTPQMFTGLTDLATKEGVKMNEAQYEKSKALIGQQLKALIARDIFDMSAYYQIINPESDLYNKALEIINSPQLYDELLEKSK